MNTKSLFDRVNRSGALDPDEFLRGQRDCTRGKPHESGNSESYDRGYAAQYEMEQIKIGVSRYGY